MAAKRTSRAREAQLAFEALLIEGGLLSPEWLSKVAQLQAGTQAEADYRIHKGLNLRDEIGRYWRIAQAHWADFKAARDAKADAKLISERFVSALLRDAFGFTELSRVEPATLQARTYPIGYATLGGRVPVIIAPAGSGLDTLSPAFGDGTRRRSAFGLAQEYLNAQEGALWGIASDGSSLRVVRDNASLTRPAWIEADLQRVFTEERYADFAALWLLCHETRFGRAGQPVIECALETWRNAGREEGTRAREHLRRGVEDALVALGQGFLSHAENQSLRADLQTGTLPVKDYFNQLLRLVYRLIFLLTVEERGLLHPEQTTEAAKTLYANGYGIRRLRERSARRSAHDRFSDLWDATKVVTRGLARGEARIGLPALAGIFAANHCPALDGAKLENRALLLAVFKLAWLREDGGLSRVNWRDMGPEELGSVYESLLELVPQITRDGRHFVFATGGETKGNARKTTGSYYTPDSLVQVLLDSALEPVIASKISKSPGNAIEELLRLSIVDPACGSGHFLLAAARRLAAQVARLHANGTPSAAEYRHALRQVVGRCIFGVDLNPMAVELCKVGLWMEAVEPGLPLTFLDSHIQHGNALLGTTTVLMAKGIPDAAWEPIEEDDKKTATALKKRNKLASEGQRSFDTLWSRGNETEAQVVTRAVAELETASDASVEALTTKEAGWRGILGSAEYLHQKFVADAWCASFVWPKRAGELAEAAPTNEVWRQIRDGEGRPSAVTTTNVNHLAEQYRFFHWHLQFPQVFANGGFDVVLGNPPWEHVELKEEEWFAQRRPDIAEAPTAAIRKRRIQQLAEEDPSLFAAFRAALRGFDAETHLMRSSGRFPLSARGRINTYGIFAEHNRSLLRSGGRAGFIVPSGIATDDTTKNFFSSLVTDRALISLFDFQSGPGLFGAIGHGTFKFSLVSLTGEPQHEAPQFAFYLRDVPSLRDPDRVFVLTPADLELLNPNTRTCPTFRSRRDADINLKIYRRVNILVREGDAERGNPWGIRFMQGLFNMSSDSGLFKLRGELETQKASLEGNRFVAKSEVYLPLIEAKMVHHFDHRFGDYRDHPEGSENLILPDVPLERLQIPDYATHGRYWVRTSDVEARLDGIWQRTWLFGWRDVTKAQNERTVVASLIPSVAVGNKFPIIVPTVAPSLVACLYGSLCSFALDYAARQKMGGTSLNYFILKQLPVLGPETYAAEAPWNPGTSLQEWIVPRVLELTYTAWDLEGFARDVGYIGPPFRWDSDRRLQLRCELDAAFFHLYGLSREDVGYVMETFPIVRKNDEKAQGEYRTKRVILELYDALAAAKIGKPYRTALDPLPADVGASHGTFSPDGTPRDYAEALRIGLLFTLVRISGERGISRNSLSRVLLWLQNAKHAAAWLDGASFTEFERIRNGDQLLTTGAPDSEVGKLLDSLENEKAVTRDPTGIVRVRAGAAIPGWLPLTPTLSRLASVMREPLERAELGADSSLTVETVSPVMAKRV
jgi:hypothetical protein